MILVFLVQFWFEMFTIQSPWVCLASGWTSSKYRLFEEVLEDQSTKVQLGIKFNSTNNVLKHFLAFIPDFDKSKTTFYVVLGAISYNSCSIYFFY